MSGSPTIPNLDAFHKQRGKLIDCFAIVEARLVQAIDRRGGKIKGDTFGAKLKTLRELAPKNPASTFDDDLARLTELNALRTDVVHGRLSICDADGVRYSDFSNARYAAQQIQPVTRLTHRGMREVTEELAAIADRIRNY